MDYQAPRRQHEIPVFRTLHGLSGFPGSFFHAPRFGSHARGTGQNEADPAGKYYGPCGGYQRQGIHFGLPGGSGTGTWVACRWVSGYVYQINPGIGAFLAVDYRYHGMIPRKELTPDIKNGRVVKARVSEVRKRDSRLVLSLNKKSYKEINLKN